MPIHNFMLADLVGCVVAVCLFPLFVLVPGYAVAWLTDLLEFRHRTSAFQLALSVPLSIAICPIVTYFAACFGSMTAVWILYAAAWTCGGVILARHRPKLPAHARTVGLIFSAWAAIAILSLIDLQMGRHSWFPSAAFDFSLRTEFIHSLTAGVPPTNPFFLPGHPVALRYHYFWLLICALVDLAGGPLVTARQAWIAGAVWCGFGMMAVVALYLRIISYRGPTGFPRRAIAGVLLLGVSGLDILPTALRWAAQLGGMRGVLPSMEWWNEQVDGFVYTALWESHYLAGLIAALTALLILWHATRVRSIVLAGLALASAAGASVYVAFVFGVFLMLWTLIELVQRRWREAAMLIAAGLTGIILSYPFAASLRGPAQGGSPLQLWVRPFLPVDALFRANGVTGGWTLPLVNLLALPLNYFLELGFFFSAALVWWKKHRAAGRPLTRAESATLLMIATSVLICTFLRSSVIGNNDLGWRGFLIAQFGLLLLAVDVIADWGAGGGRDQRVFLTVLLVLGVTGSVYEIAINRFYPVLADGGVVATVSWFAPDRQAGARNYAQREAAEWAAASTPPDAVVQFNPHVETQDTSTYLYSDRRTLAGDERCLSVFGGDPALCPALIAALDGIYPPAGQPAVPALDSVCRTLPIDLIGAIDTDPGWHDRNSWVWTEAPVFANAYVRLFRCAARPSGILR